MPDSSDDAAIAIADVLLEFINALAQHAVARYGVYDDASSAKSDLFGVKPRHRRKAPSRRRRRVLRRNIREPATRRRARTVRVRRRRVSTRERGVRRVPVRRARWTRASGETPSAARKRDARDALAATATKFVFVADEGARKARLATAREGRVEFEIVAEATSEDAPEGWRATSTTDVDRRDRARWWESPR